MEDRKLMGEYRSLQWQPAVAAPQLALLCAVRVGNAVIGELGKKSKLQMERRN